jgi:outer membrane lipoprotein LolB
VKSVARKLCLFFCAFSLSLVMGCKIPQYSTATFDNVAQLHHFEVQGKIGIRKDHRGMAGNFHLRQQEKAYQLTLSGPLSSGSIQLIGNEKETTLTNSNGEIYRARTPEKLIANELGWTIPVSGLCYWLRGLPAPGKQKGAIVLNNSGQVTELRQNDWIIYYENYKKQQGIDLPYKLRLYRQSMQVKLIIRRWDLHPSDKHGY